MTLEIGWQQPADDVVQVGQIKQVVQGAVGSRLRHRWQVAGVVVVVGSVGGGEGETDL